MAGHLNEWRSPQRSLGKGCTDATKGKLREWIATAKFELPHGDLNSNSHPRSSYAAPYKVQVLFLILKVYSIFVLFTFELLINLIKKIQ